MAIAYMCATVALAQERTLLQQGGGERLALLCVSDFGVVPSLCSPTNMTLTLTCPPATAHPQAAPALARSRALTVVALAAVWPLEVVR